MSFVIYNLLMQDLQNAPIIQFEKLSEIDLVLKSGKKTVLVGGCFDILHLGHVVFLEKAKELGDLLVVSIESDRFIREEKKREPFHTQKQRAYVLSALRSVDLVIEMPFLPKEERSEKYGELVKMVSPNYIAVSENDKMQQKKLDHAKTVGAEVKIVTKILKSLSSSTIAKYGALLSG